MERYLMKLTKGEVCFTSLKLWYIQAMGKVNTISTIHNIDVRNFRGSLLKY